MSEIYVGKVNVLLIVVYKDVVMLCFILVCEQGFELFVVDVEGYVLGNVIDYFYLNKGEDECVCCINIGVLLL